MALIQLHTETKVFQSNQGVSLKNARGMLDTKDNQAKQTFVQATKLVQSQKGFIRQLWGHQVEDPSMFVWYIQWQSLEDFNEFKQSDGHTKMMHDLEKVFDHSNRPPTTIFTQWTSDPAAALQAPVTEVAFFALPRNSGEAPRREIEEAMVSVMKDVTTVGKSLGGAIGWVSAVASLPPHTVSEGQELALHGVFGYVSIEDHMKWRETPEHMKIIATMTHFATDRGLSPAAVGGKSMFHVRFESDV